MVSFQTSVLQSSWPQGSSLLKKYVDTLQVIIDSTLVNRAHSGLNPVQNKRSTPHNSAHANSDWYTSVHPASSSLNHGYKKLPCIAHSPCRTKTAQHVSIRCIQMAVSRSKSARVFSSQVHHKRFDTNDTEASSLQRKHQLSSRKHAVGHHNGLQVARDLPVVNIATVVS